MNITKFNLFSFFTFMVVSLYSFTAVFAAEVGLTKIAESVGVIGKSIIGLTGVVFTLSIIFFFWKVGLFIFASDATSRSDARKGMLNGLIAVFIIASIWGIVALLQGATGISTDKGSINAPGINTST